jgi:hypothetical protein
MSDKAPSGLGTRLPLELMTMIIHKLAALPGPSPCVSTDAEHHALPTTPTISGRDALARLMRTSHAMHDLVGPILYSRIALTRNNADALFYGLPRRAAAPKTSYAYASKEARSRALAKFEARVAEEGLLDIDGSVANRSTELVAKGYWRGRFMDEGEDWLMWSGDYDDGDSDYYDDYDDYEEYRFYVKDRELKDARADYESLSETDDETPSGRYRPRRSEAWRAPRRRSDAEDEGDTAPWDVEDESPQEVDVVVPAPCGRLGTYFPLPAKATSARKLQLLAQCRVLHVVQIPNQSLLADCEGWSRRPFPNVEHLALSSRALSSTVKLKSYLEHVHNYTDPAHRGFSGPRSGRLARSAERFLAKLCGRKITNTCLVCPHQGPTTRDIFRFVRGTEEDIEDLDSEKLQVVMESTAYVCLVA